LGILKSLYACLCDFEKNIDSYFHNTKAVVPNLLRHSFSLPLQIGPTTFNTLQEVHFNSSRTPPPNTFYPSIKTLCTTDNCDQQDQILQHQGSYWKPVLDWRLVYWDIMAVM